MNLVFVLSDQHRVFDLGCYGNHHVQTPALDAFARRATRFTQCISNSPLCVPARGSLLTGCLPIRHGAITNDLPLREDVTTIANVLHDAGYATGYVGKWHLDGIPRDKPIADAVRRRGFSECKAYNCNHEYYRGYYYDEKNQRISVEGYEPITQTDLAVDFIERRHREPFALFLSYGPPHDPYDQVPERHLSSYRDQALPLRPNVPETITSRSKFTSKIGVELFPHVSEHRVECRTS